MIKVTQNSFLGGQLDFEMMGRQDYAKYRKGASVLKNFNILKRGGITKRQGFDHVLDISTLAMTVGGETIPNDSKLRIVPFAYKKDHGFVLLFAGSVSREDGTSYSGGCWAVYTMQGCVHNTWSIPVSSGVTYFTNDEIGEFDYAQSGYKLFIAHSNHHPSEIWTNEKLVTDAISGSIQSPFSWISFDIGKVLTGIPTISSASQSRIAPSADTASGTYTEKYKVSASYEDGETKTCEAFYNESCIEPVSITQTTGGTCIQRSTSTTAGYTNKTYDKEDTSVAAKSTSVIPEITNTSATYSNKVSATCKGTKYYLPWVESQTINLTINAVTRNGEYPERINVYKRASGYYGLVGTINTKSDGTNGNVSKSMTENSVSEYLDEIIGSQTERKWENKVSANISATATDTHGYGYTGYSFDTTGKIVITPTSSVTPNSSLKLYLCKAQLEFTSWHTSLSKPYYNRPKACRFSLIPNTCTSIKLTIGYSYTKTDDTLVGSSIVSNVSIPSVSASSSTYESSSYDTFAKNYASQYKTWRNALPSTLSTVSLSEIVTDPADKKTGTRVHITKITIEPNNGSFTINGIGLLGSSETTFTFVDNNITPDTSITPIDDNYEPPFSAPNDYPSTVAVYQQRLVWASSNNDPENVWMSSVGDFYDYTEHEIQKDSDALEFSMPVTRFAKMNHIVEMKRLLAFNSACEWIIDSASSQKGITYETIRAMPQSYSGSNARMKPLICNNTLVFTERTGQSVRRFAYNIQDDGFAGRDVSILASSIFEHNNIIDWTYQQQPLSTIWCVLSDGTMASLEIMEEQDIIAWATHKHGDPNAKITNIATSYAMSPSLADIESSLDEHYKLATTEEVFAIVEHVNGSTVTRTLERMRVRSKPTDSIYNSVCMDSVKIATAVTTLEANQIGINPVTGAITSSGSVPVGTIIGYPYESKFTSVYPVIGEQYVGGGQFAIKNLNNLHLRLESSQGGKVSAAVLEDEAMPIRYDDEKGNDRSPVKGLGVATFKNCDAANCHPVGCNNRDGRISIMHDEPWPFTLLSYEAEYATENERYVSTI